MREILNLAVWLGRIFVESVLFAFIVGLLLLNADGAAKVRQDALHLISQADYVAREGIDPAINWADNRRSDAYSAMDSTIVSLRARVPENIFSCLTDAVGLAKRTHSQTIPDPAASINKMETRYHAARQAVDDWYWAETFTLGLLWAEDKKLCD